ncbi:hypothetical protein [Kocuria rhizosphaerae]|uniref:hypothetical protein n=1 Tax=Kocuria rhizosphaerae TaxID=3376285 RepID=UPI0037BEE4BF
MDALHQFVAASVIVRGKAWGIECGGTVGRRVSVMESMSAAPPHARVVAGPLGQVSRLLNCRLLPVALRSFEEASMVEGPAVEISCAETP